MRKLRFKGDDPIIFESKTSLHLEGAMELFGRIVQKSNPNHRQILEIVPDERWRGVKRLQFLERNFREYKKGHNRKDSIIVRITKADGTAFSFEDIIVLERW